MDLARCDKCGVELHISDWPYCPHGEAHSSVIGDDVPGGFTVENGFDRPQTFYSKQAHREALAARGLEIRAKYAGPLDKVMTNWAAGISQHQLDGARRMLERGSIRVEHKQDVAAQFPIQVRDVKLAEVTE